MKLAPLSLPFLSLLTLFACAPSALDETGKLCTPARPCSPAYVCAAGVCARGTPFDGDAGTDGGVPGTDGGALGVNWLINPGFEDTPPGHGWVATPGTPNILFDTGAPHAGSRSIELLDNASEVFGLAPLAPPVEATLAGGFYCASAWVKGTALVTQLKLVLEEGSPGSVATSESPVTGAGDTWVQLRVHRQASGARPLTVHLIDVSASMDVFYADDFQLWRSADARCSEL